MFLRRHAIAGNPGKDPGQGDARQQKASHIPDESPPRQTLSPNNILVHDLRIDCILNNVFFAKWSLFIPGLSYVWISTLFELTGIGPAQIILADLVELILADLVEITLNGLVYHHAVWPC